jgi:hypothetical protein
MDGRREDTQSAVTKIIAVVVLFAMLVVAVGSCIYKYFRHREAVNAAVKFHYEEHKQNDQGR